MDEVISWIVIELLFGLFGRVIRAVWPFGKIKRYSALTGAMFWIALSATIGLFAIGLVTMGLISLVFAFIFMIIALVYDAEEHEIRKQLRRERREAKRRLRIEEA